MPQITQLTQPQSINVGCLPPRNHTLMCHIVSDEQTLVSSSIEGLHFTASYVHAFTGDWIRDVEVHLPPDQRVYFAASSSKHWYFILQFSAYYQRFGCSCLQGKLYNRTHKPCEHMVTLTESVNTEVL